VVLRRVVLRRVVLRRVVLRRVVLRRVVLRRVVLRRVVLRWVALRRVVLGLRLWALGLASDLPAEWRRVAAGRRVSLRRLARDAVLRPGVLVRMTGPPRRVNGALGVDIKRR
jgi:Pentapeptide repeats (8 copies)